MPGIIATIAPEDENAINSRLHRMSAALEPEQRFTREFYAQNGFGFGRTSLGIVNECSQPVWDVRRRAALVMEGELYDTPSLLGLLERDGVELPVENHAEILLNLYLLKGEAGLALLNGSFCAALWIPSENRLVVVNDRLGSHPVYYSPYVDGIGISSGVRALITDRRTRRQVDRVAIQEFLTFDHVLGQRTLLEDVKLLPQGSVLEYQDAKLNIRRYYNLNYPHHYPLKEEDAYRGELIDLLKTAVRRQNRDDLEPGLLLSGGLDSRVLLAELVAQGTQKPLQTFTWSIPNSDDARAARELAAKSGVRHHFFELKPDWLLHQAERAVRITDGMGNLVNLHALATLEEESRLANVIYKGFLGDAMFGFALRPRFWADYEESDCPEVHLRAYRDYDVLTFDLPAHDRIFTDSFLSDTGDGLMQDFTAGMAASGVKQLASQRLYFDFTQRVPRMTLNGVLVVRDRAAVRLPFADNDLVEFSTTMPPGMHYERRLMIEAFIQAYPKLARVPLAKTGLPMVSTAREIWLRNLQFMKWHLRRMGLEGLVGPATRPYKDYHAWFRGILRPWVESVLLDQRTLDRGYYKPASVRQIVNEHMAGKNHSVRLGALMAIELWHRMYLD